MISAVAGQVRQDLAAAGGSVFGLFQGQIGFAANEGALITAGGERGAVEIQGVAGWTSELLTPTARPAEPAPPVEPGVYAHRWFHLAATDVEEFVDLSARAWGAFEGRYRTRIAGLWRADPHESVARLLLVTWYASLADWEASRPAGSRPASDDVDWENARRLFARRAQLTKWTIVRTTTLVRLPD